MAVLIVVIIITIIPDYHNEAFASPPVLDHDSALACSDFVTTIVNNADVIPRASLSNLMIFLEFLKTVSEKLEEKGLSPNTVGSARAFLRSMSMSNGDDGKGGVEMFMTADEIRSGVDAAAEKVDLRDPDHLYVPGRVLLMYDLWSKTSNITVANDAGIAAEVRTAEKLLVTDGTSKILRLIEMDDRMIT